MGYHKNIKIKVESIFRKRKITNLRATFSTLAEINSWELVIYLQIINYNLDPSRRDDLISLLYMMIYIADGTLPWIPESSLNG
jgi:hypothetical protein